jgi:transposase InsO family protein
MPFAARRRHQYWTSDVRYIDHELGGRVYLVSVMDNHSRCILSSALTCSQDLSSFLAVLYAAVERYGSPTLGGLRRCSLVSNLTRKYALIDGREWLTGVRTPVGTSGRKVR